MNALHHPKAADALRRLPGVMLLLLMLLPLQAGAQLQLGAYSSHQSNSNPNRISDRSREGDDVGDYLGLQAFWLGYDLTPASSLTISPFYSIGLTHWGSATEQNFLQHDLSLFISWDDLHLLSRRPSPIAIEVDDAALRSLAGYDPLKDSLVEWIYDIAGEIADAAQGPATEAAEPEMAEADDASAEDDDWWIDELIGDEDDEGTAESDSIRYAAIDDLLANGVEFGAEPDSIRVVQAAEIVAEEGGTDSLMYAVAESMLDIADSLDMDEGALYQIEATSWHLRRFRTVLAAALPPDDFRSRIDARLDSLLAALTAYGAGDSVSTAGIEEDESFDFAAVSLSHRPLIRHTARSYDFQTLPSDAGADRLQLYGGLATGSYLSDDAALLGYDQFESTIYYGSLLLEQQLGSLFDLWAMLSLAHEAYPAEPLFDNTQTEIAAQLRYQPSTRLAVVLDAAYGLKNYRDDLTQPAGRGSASEVAVDTAASTSLFDLGLGLFFRPIASTLLGVVVARQMTPELHPRLLLTVAPGRASRRGSSQLAGGVVTSQTSNISDDIFSWNGSDVQLLVMQSLPWDLVATLFYDHNVRDYGQLTATLNGRTTRLDDRTDTRRTFELSVARDFFPGDGSQMISAGVAFGTIDNASTNFTRRQIPGGDYDYNFSETYLSVQVQWVMF